MSDPTLSYAPQTDRNLLFGVLALKSDLIDGQQFAAACKDWAADKDVPLAEVLSRRGWIRPADREHLDYLLARRLEMHGGDARASLAGLIDSSARDALATVEDAEVRQSLSGPTPQPAHVLVESVGPGRGERYSLTRLHATGGIGRVWLARDGDLGREVALKELRPEGSDNPGLWARFLAEAKITGQLEHPGIVPIYELARRPGDQQPFYTMRFVRGRTLSQAARAYQARRGAAEAKPLEFRELLQAFVGVCNAVAYAHSRGVVHRDLKGSNVILGDYGEVMVLDWGLARVLDAPATADDDTSLITLSPTEGQHGTVQGQVLGTPAFMAPEQAAGRLDLLSPRTDVYGLGAILYEVLTGRPPFSGADTNVVLRQVREVEPVAPRQFDPALSPALEAVCRQAMAKRPDARYDSAAALAREVQHWLADEPVNAYPEPLPKRVARWARRHRPLVAGAAALLVTAVVGLTIGTVLIARQQRLTEQARAQAVEHFEEAEFQRGKAEASARDADAQRVRAEGNFEKAREAVDKLLTRVGDQRLRGLPQMERLRKELLEEALRFNRKFLDEKSEDPGVRRDAALAHGRLGQLYNHLGRTEDSEKALGEAIRLARKLHEEFPDNDTFVHVLALALGERAHTRETAQTRLKEAEEDARESLRLMEPVGARKPYDRRVQDDLADAHNNLANVLQTTKPDESLAAYAACEKIRLQLVARYPDDPNALSAVALTYFNTGNLHWIQHRYPEAEESYRKALPLFVRLVREFDQPSDYRHALADATMGLGNALQYQDRTDAAAKMFAAAAAEFELLREEFPGFPNYRASLLKCHINVGNLRYQTRKFADAETPYRTALALQAKLVADFPDNKTYREMNEEIQIGLGNVCQYTGRLAEAAKFFDGSIERLTVAVKDPEAAPETRRLMAAALANRGNLHVLQDQDTQAERLYVKSLPLTRKLVEEFPDRRLYQEDLANLLVSMGNIYQDSGRFPAAEKAFDEAIRRFQKLADHYPRAAEFRRMLAMTHYNRGNLLSLGRRLDDAEPAYRKALAILDKLVEEFPDDSRYKEDRAPAWLGLGNVLQYTERYDEAEKLFHASLGFYEDAMKRSDNPSNPQHVGMLCYNLGNLLAHSDRADESGRWYERSVDILTKLVEKHPGNAAYRADLASSYNNLGMYLADTGPPRRRDPAGAVKAAQKAVELLPVAGPYWNTLGIAHFRSGAWKEARDAMDKSVKLRGFGSDPNDWFFLAMIHHQLGDKDEAKKWFDRSVKWMKAMKSEDKDLLRYQDEASKLLGQP